MFKKSLLRGSITLALLVLFALSGCSNPAANDGPVGERGALAAPAGAISAPLLKELFTDNNIVLLPEGVTSVAGIVPPGKTLEVAASNVAVTAGLTVEGKLHILEPGAISTNGIFLTLAPGSVAQVDGFIDHLAVGIFEFDGSIARNVVFGSTGGLILEAAVNVDRVNTYFTLVNNIRWANTTPVTLANLAALTEWTFPAKKLILTGATLAPTDDIDVSDKGALVIGTPVAATPTTFTVADTKVLKANGSAVNVIVAESGILALAGTGRLEGNMKVNGRFSVAATSSEIPAGVDLSAATLTTSNDAGIFKFPQTNPVRIAKLDLATNNLGIANTSELNVGLITNAANKTLTLPNNIITTVDRIQGVAVLTIKGETGGLNSKARLVPRYVFGAGFTLGSDIVIEGGAVSTLESTAAITVSNLVPFGNDTAKQLEQIALINGGAVNIGSNAVDFVAETTLKTRLITSGAVTVTENVVLNAGAALTNVTNVIKAGKTLTVGPGASVTFGTLLDLQAGAYIAGTHDVTFNGSTSAISIPSAGTLSVEGIVLKSNGAAGTFTPTASTSKTIIYGGLGAIVVTNGGTAGVLTLGANAEIDIAGGGSLALEDGAKIVLSAATAKISGFTWTTAIAAGSMVGTSDKHKGAKGTIFEAHQNGVTYGVLLAYTAATADDVGVINGAATTNDITGTTNTGGVVTKNSLDT
jgi:hypothetical protein